MMMMMLAGRMLLQVMMMSHEPSRAVLLIGMPLMRLIRTLGHNASLQLRGVGFD